MTVKIDGTNTVANPAFTGADTDTGLQVGTNEVKLVTGGTARATVDSSGRLLVGTSSGSSEPIAAFQGRATDANDGGMIAISRAGASPSGSIGELRFSTGDALNKYYGMIVGASDGTTSSTSLPGMLRFSTTSSGSTSPTERLRITSDGTLQLRSSPGIDFSQIQTNASGMTSETLDSYEEGTFTPSLTFTTPGNHSFTYSLQTGFYTKIGRLAHYRMEIRLSSFSKGTATGDLKVQGLPFTSADLGNGQFVGSLATFNAPLTTVDGEYPVFNVSQNAATGFFKLVRPNNSWNVMNDPDGNSQYKIDVTVFTA